MVFSSERPVFAHFFDEVSPGPLSEPLHVSLHALSPAVEGDAPEEHLSLHVSAEEDGDRFLVVVNAEEEHLSLDALSPEVGADEDDEADTTEEHLSLHVSSSQIRFFVDLFASSSLRMSIMMSCLRLGEGGIWHASTSE